MSKTVDGTTTKYIWDGTNIARAVANKTAKYDYDDTGRLIKDHV